MTTIQNKPIALITGANQGIGFQIAKDMTAKGFAVLLGSRSIERGEAAAKQLGSNAIAIQLDVTLTSIAAAAKRVREKFRRLNVLLQNAAITTSGDHHAQTPQGDA